MRLMDDVPCSLCNDSTFSIEHLHLKFFVANNSSHAVQHRAVFRNGKIKWLLNQQETSNFKHQTLYPKHLFLQYINQRSGKITH